MRWTNDEEDIGVIVSVSCPKKEEDIGVIVSVSCPKKAVEKNIRIGCIFILGPP